MTGKVPRIEGIDEDAAVAEWEVPERGSQVLRGPGSIAAVFMHCTPISARLR